MVTNAAFAIYSPHARSLTGPPHLDKTGHRRKRFSQSHKRRGEPLVSPITATIRTRPAPHHYPAAERTASRFRSWPCRTVPGAQVARPSAVVEELGGGLEGHAQGGGVQVGE